MSTLPNDDAQFLTYSSGIALTAVPVIPIPPTLSGVVDTLNRGSVDYLFNVTARTANVLEVVPIGIAGLTGLGAPIGYFEPGAGVPVPLAVRTLMYEIDITAIGLYWLRGVPVVGNGMRLQLAATGAGSTATVSVVYFRRGAQAQGSSPAVFG